MPAALPRRGEEDVDDRKGERLAEQTTAEREHVGIVVLARQARRRLVVAQRGARAVHLVGRDLLALAAAADDDAELGVTTDDRPRRRRAEHRVVDGFLAVGA